MARQLGLAITTTPPALLVLAVLGLLTGLIVTLLLSYTGQSSASAAAQALAKRLSPLFDVVFLAALVPSAIVLLLFRRFGARRLRLSRTCLQRLGVFPIRDHYYEPIFRASQLSKPLHSERRLPGISFNLERQLAFVNSLSWAEELTRFPLRSARRGNTSPEFYFGNGGFESGDAEIWYLVVRNLKPKRIIEIGCGFSTILAHEAVNANSLEVPGYRCQHICIEPYEQPWLENLGVKVIRERVERLDRSTFSDLQENDILFIDSSHVLRPQGDVITQILEILPTLQKGVTIHFHDIFSPRDLPHEWLFEFVWFWYEQYLLEAFLSCNPAFEVVCSVNYLKHAHFDCLRRKCVRMTPEREPGSFYIKKVS